MTGGNLKRVKFSIRNHPDHDAIMVIQYNGGQKEYPLTQEDLYRLQNEGAEAIIVNKKRGRDQHRTPTPPSNRKMEGWF